MSKVAKVDFDGSERVYDYAVPKSLEKEIRVGDMAVVYALGKYQIVTINDIVDRDLSEWDAEELPMKVIITTFNLEDAQAMQAVEDRKQAILKEIDMRARRADRRAQLEEMASKDDSVRDLVEELASL